MEQSFQPLLFGGDINVYSVARAFHEAYGVVSICYGIFPSGPAYGSHIVEYRPCPQNEEAETFLKNVRYVAQEFPGKTILVIPCGDSYVKLTAQCKEAFPENCITATTDAQEIETLSNKEQFYALCDRHGIDHPKTFLYRRELGEDFDLPFPPPYICKPANGVAYWEHPFPGNEKVFLCPDRDSLHSVLARVYDAGYPDTMIIQDFVPGDDSFMRVLTAYSDRQGKVKMMCLGHVLLEEHTPHGIGNHAVILTEEDTALCEKFRAFLEAIGYRGFSNFDLKYDQRSGNFQAFEINCRQGRSNYYVTGSGCNLARLLVEDLVEQRELPFTLVTKPSLWRVVPRKVAYRYIDSAYHGAIQARAGAGEEVNPVFYRPDPAPVRWVRMMKNHLSHYQKFKRYYTPKS